MAGPHNEDTLMITRTLNAAAIRGIMDDARWEHVIEVVTKLLESARARENAARRNPTLDGLLQATQFNGRVLALEDLLRVFTTMYDRSGMILTEARKKLPYAPTPKGDRKGNEAPTEGHLQGGSHGRRQKGRKRHTRSKPAIKGRRRKADSR